MRYINLRLTYLLLTDEGMDRQHNASTCQSVLVESEKYMDNQPLAPYKS